MFVSLILTVRESQKSNHKSKGFVSTAQKKAPGGIHLFEEAISAYSLPYKKRPELMRLLAAARRGEFKTVIVYKLSRIARTAGEMGLILGLFEIDYQVEVISVLDFPNQTKQERVIGRALHGGFSLRWSATI